MKATDQGHDDRPFARSFLYDLWRVGRVRSRDAGEHGATLPERGRLDYGSHHRGNHGEPALASLILAAASGAILGDNIAYWAGRKAGLPLVQHYGHYVGLTEPRLRLGRYLFLRYEGRVVFFGRFVSVLRIFAALFAGVNRMPIARFVLANALGGAAWATIVASGAYVLGTDIHRMHKPVALAGAVLAFVAVVAIALWLRQEEGRLQADADRALSEYF